MLRTLRHSARLLSALAVAAASFATAGASNMQTAPTSHPNETRAALWIPHPQQTRVALWIPHPQQTRVALWIPHPDNAGTGAATTRSS